MNGPTRLELLTSLLSRALLQTGRGSYVLGRNFTSTNHTIKTWLHSPQRGGRGEQEAPVKSLSPTLSTTLVSSQRGLWDWGKSHYPHPLLPLLQPLQSSRESIEPLISPPMTLFSLPHLTSLPPSFPPTVFLFPCSPTAPLPSKSVSLKVEDCLGYVGRWAVLWPRLWRRARGGPPTTASARNGALGLESGAGPEPPPREAPGRRGRQTRKTSRNSELTRGPLWTKSRGSRTRGRGEIPPRQHSAAPTPPLPSMWKTVSGFFWRIYPRIDSGFYHFHND